MNKPLLVHFAAAAIVLGKLSVADAQHRRCTAWDDPHFWTFSGLTFNYYGEGLHTYVSLPDLEIQASTFRAAPGLPTYQNSASFASGGHLVTVQLSDPVNDIYPELRIDGFPQPTTGGLHYTYTAGGFRISVRDGRSIDVVVPSIGVSTELRTYSSVHTNFMNITVHAPVGAGESRGLCGHNTLNPADDSDIWTYFHDHTLFAPSEQDRIPRSCDRTETELPNRYCNCDQGGHIAGQCNDGNMASGDGCSDRCTVEPGWVCEGDPSVCNSDEQAAFHKCVAEKITAVGLLQRCRARVHARALKRNVPEDTSVCERRFGRNFSRAEIEKGCHDLPFDAGDRPGENVCLGDIATNGLVGTPCANDAECNGPGLSPAVCGAEHCSVGTVMEHTLQSFDALVRHCRDGHIEHPHAHFCGPGTRYDAASDICVGTGVAGEATE